MAKRDVTTLFKALLLQFIREEDPLLSMLQWMTQTLMQVEAENKVGAEKGKQATNRRTYFSGYRWRRFDTRMGTTYLCVPKVRNGGYWGGVVQGEGLGEYIMNFRRRMFDSASAIFWMFNDV
jgi:putative transposase